jgi:hypothetical protein
MAGKEYQSKDGKGVSVKRWERSISQKMRKEYQSKDGKGVSVKRWERSISQKMD